MLLNKLYFTVCAVIGLFIFLVTGLPAQNATDSTPKWRHLSLTHDVESNQKLSLQINKLGNEGWELVDVENITKDGTTEKTVFY